MRVVRLISLIARVALLVTMTLGVLFWIAQMPVLQRLLILLVQINLTSIHEGFGIIGVLALLVLGNAAISTREIRPLGVGSMIYALLVPVFGLTQALILVGNLHWLIQIAHLLMGIGAMFLARKVEKCYRCLRKAASPEASPQANRVSSDTITSQPGAAER